MNKLRIYISYMKYYDVKTCKILKICGSGKYQKI